MGHFCRICGMVKANEKFSGKGHKRHICKVCSKLPKDEIAEIEQFREISGFLEQSNISKKNKKRLRELTGSKNPGIAEQALLVLEVAEFRSYKKRRIKQLAQKRPNLLYKLKEAGLVFTFYFDEKPPYLNIDEEPPYLNIDEEPPYLNTDEEPPYLNIDEEPPYLNGDELPF